MIEDLFAKRSFLPLDEEPGQFLQSFRAGPEAVELSKSLAYQFVGLLLRLFNSKQRGIRRFFRGSILACGLPQLLRGLRYVENIVHDLKRQANAHPEATEL